MNPIYTPLPLHITAAFQQEAKRMLAEASFQPTHPEVTAADFTGGPEGTKTMGVHSRHLPKEGFTTEQVDGALQELVDAATTAVHNQDLREVEMAGGPVVREIKASIHLLDQPPTWDEETQEWVGDGTTFHFAISVTCRWAPKP